MPIYVVAVEYLGADLPPHQGARRRPICEHAYDLTTGNLAHADKTTRIGFPQPIRGWPRHPQSRRCPACTHVVADVIADLVRRALSQLKPVTEARSTSPGILVVSPAMGSSPP